jgi:hypothetical protein
VFLQEPVDSRNRRADAAIGVAHVVAEKVRDQNHDRQGRKRYQAKERAPFDQHDGQPKDKDKIVEHRGHARGK